MIKVQYPYQMDQETFDRFKRTWALAFRKACNSDKFYLSTNIALQFTRFMQDLDYVTVVNSQGITLGEFRPDSKLLWLGSTRLYSPKLVFVNQLNIFPDINSSSISMNCLNQVLQPAEGQPLNVDPDLLKNVVLQSFKNLVLE